MELALARLLPRAQLAAPAHPDTDVTGHIADLLESAELSSGGLPLLGMGRDVPDGRMYLRRGRLDVDWKRHSSDAYFDRLRTTSRAVARSLGGRFADNPIWFLKRVITVHPLGRLPDGRPSGEGVVDSYGNVFGYPGLHIADGSVMPGPTGPNPSFTIAALADRFADSIIEEIRRGGGRIMTTTVSPRSRERAVHRGDARPHHVRRDRLQPRVGRRPAGGRVLHVPPDDLVDDIQRFGVDPMRQAGAFGWVKCDALGGRLAVERGVFNLFVDTEPGVKHMLYRLFFRDGVGHPLTMTGYKLVRDDAGFDVWRDTTTLFTRVLRGHVEDFEERGRAGRVRRPAHPRA